MKEKIEQLVLAAAAELNEQLDDKIAVEKGTDAPLFGKEGALDSLGLVSFIVMVEEAVEDEFDACLTLADEKAMSKRTSPFRTVGSLVGYVEDLLREEG